MSKTLPVITGVIAAGVAFVVLYPILGVTLWISFLVAGCILAALTIGSMTAIH